MQGIAVIGVEKYKTFLGENTPRPLLLNAIPHQTFCYQQTIYHFSTLGIVWSLFVHAPPPTDKFLKMLCFLCMQAFTLFDELYT
jgi:hypothetical protein